jgi:pimeloyl-ACP methyl ester carboxylesterase
MPVETYNNLAAEMNRLYAEQNYKGVYDLLTAEGERFPEEAFTVLYMRSCMAARIGQNDHAIDLLREAASKGIWYGEAIMRQSPSWQPLQGLPAFEEMAALFKQREKDAYVGPLMLIEEPVGGCSTDKPCPTLLTLHGNGANARLSLRGWHAASEMGWLQASLQSSLVRASDSFVWDDQDVVLPEIAAHYTDLITRYNVDKDRVILAGFSMGGETALRAALTGAVPVEGFILLGPGGPTIDEPDQFLPMIQEAQSSGRSLRGYVFLGEQDDLIIHDAVRKLVVLLNENNIPCHLESVPTIAHEYPADFAPYIARAIAFIEH